MTPRLHAVRPGPHSRVLGFGSYLPERVVSNDDLAATLDTSDRWIRTRVGIARRRYAAADTSVVDMASAAGAKALADAGLAPSDVDCVIVATCTTRGSIPNAAARVADRIGLPAPGGFDLNAGCAGFCYALGSAAALVAAGTAGRVLVIGAEKLTDWLDFTDRTTAVLFGDGAGAAVVGPSDLPMIGPVVWGTAGDRASAIGLRDDRYIRQDGLDVYLWATQTVPLLAARAVEAAGLDVADIDVLVPHQANLRIIQSIRKELQALGARPDLVIADDIVESGNTSSASVPLAIDHMRSDGRISSGDVVLLAGFGTGLAYAAQVVICP